MRRIEQYGTQLAMLLRRRREHQAELIHIEEQISRIEERLFTDPPERLYALASGEYPQVGDERPTQRIIVAQCPGTPCWAFRDGLHHVHDADGAAREIPA